MDFFETKYGIEENEKIKSFHKSRRMFCIYKNKLVIAEPNLSYSHATWFEKEGWITKENDELMGNIVRGIIDNEGDIYFYVGYDFQINSYVEKIFFYHVRELIQKLKLNPSSKIFGGLIKKGPGKKWPIRKEFGQIKDYLS